MTSEEKACILQIVLVIGVIHNTLQVTFVIAGFEFGSKQIIFHSTTKVVLLKYYLPMCLRIRSAASSSVLPSIEITRS